MRKSTVAAMRAHAVREYPRESCGLVVLAAGREEYFPCANTAIGGAHFVMAPDDYAAAEDIGDVVALVHSHPDAPAAPSEADRVACEATGLPWYIVEVRADSGEPTALEVHAFRPEGYRAPLIGRPFFHGVLDCYSLVRDYYARERGIDLPDFERQDGWWDGDQELYLDNFAAAGFRPLADSETIQPGDVILMQVLSKRTNHAAVYLGGTELKEAPGLHPLADAMIHHLRDRLSERAVYGGYWQDATRLILRHQ